MVRDQPIPLAKPPASTTEMLCVKDAICASLADNHNSRVLEFANWHTKVRQNLEEKKEIGKFSDDSNLPTYPVNEHLSDQLGTQVRQPLQLFW